MIGRKVVASCWVVLAHCSPSWAVRLWVILTNPQDVCRALMGGTASPLGTVAVDVVGGVVGDVASVQGAVGAAGDVVGAVSVGRVVEGTVGVACGAGSAVGVEVVVGQQ